MTEEAKRAISNKLHKAWVPASHSPPLPLLEACLVNNSSHPPKGSELHQRSSNHQLREVSDKHLQQEIYSDKGWAQLPYRLSQLDNSRHNSSKLNHSLHLKAVFSANRNQLILQDYLKHLPEEQLYLVKMLISLKVCQHLLLQVICLARQLLVQELAVNLRHSKLVAYSARWHLLLAQEVYSAKHHKLEDLHYLAKTKDLHNLRSSQ